ncbi:MAG: hypothetical protein HOO96_30235 [Polyangiaceae bacterium]|nr:hypothetical protein [Polyangiaceae bacterium]
MKKLGLGAALATLLVATGARASSTEEHRALMLAGQFLQHDGKLLRAQELFQEAQAQPCDADADAECPEIRAYCGRKLQDLVRELPSARVHVVDDRGTPVASAITRIGSVLVHDGDTVSLDPGRYLLQAEAGGRSASRSFELHRSEHADVEVTLDLRRTVTARPVTWLTWSLGAAAGAGLLGVAGFGTATVAQQGSFASCSPTCAWSKRSTYETTMYATDVSLAVVVVAGIGTLVSFLARPSVVRTERIDVARGR